MLNKKRIISVMRKEIDKMSCDELWEEFSWLRPSCQLMYEAHGELNNLVKRHCWGDGRKKRDPYLEEHLVRTHIQDPFNPFDIMCAARLIGRTPMTTFDIWIGYIWDEVEKDRLGALKKTIRYAVKHNYAEFI